MGDPSADTSFDTQTTSNTTALTFVKRQGTVTHGVDYEIAMAAYYALAYSLRPDVSDVLVGSNVHGYGVFDDLVIRVEYEEKRPKLYAMQLKHKETPDPIIKANDFNKKDGAYSLKKYKDCYYNEIKEELRSPTNALAKDISIDDLYVCLLTNGKIENRTTVPAESSLLSCRLSQSLAQDFISTKSNVGHYKFQTTRLLPELSNFLCDILQNSVFTFTRSATSTCPVEEVIEFVRAQIKSRLNGEQDSFKVAIEKAAVDAKLKYSNSTDVIKHARIYFKQELQTAANSFHAKSFPNDKDYKEFVAARLQQVYDTDIYRSAGLQILRDFPSKTLEEIMKSLRTKQTAGDDQPVREDVERILNDDYFQYEFKAEKEREYSDFFSRFLFYDQQADYVEVKENITKLLKQSLGEELPDITKQFVEFVEMHFEEKSELLSKQAIKLKLLELSTGITDKIDLDRKYEIFKDITDMRDYSQRVKVLREIKVSLQGRSAVSLCDIATKQFHDRLSSEFLLKNLCQTIKVGSDKIYKPEVYIKRRCHKVLLRAEVLWETTGNIFILDVALPAHLHHKVTYLDQVNSGDRFSSKNYVVVLGRDKLYETVDEIKNRKEFGSFSIHRLKVCTPQYLEWQKSWRKIDQLNQFVVEGDSVEEQDVLHHFVRKLNVISAVPGMGKTTMLHVLASYCPPDLLALKLDLNPHDRDLRNETSPLRRNPLEFACDAAKSRQNDKFECDLFEDLRREKKLVLFVDGFDEISPTHSETVLSIIGAIKEKEIPIWIFTRPLAKTLIEEQFSVMSIAMVHLSREEVQHYLTQKTIATNAETVNFLTDHTVCLYTVPIYLSMLADVCDHHTSLQELRVTDLYKRFIEINFEKYIEKLGLDKEANRTKDMVVFYKSKYQDIHKTAALYVIFGSAFLIDKNISTNAAIDDMITKFNDCSVNYPLIVNLEDEIPVFLHRTYAEYLAAVWVFENASKYYDILFDPQYQTVRLMFDRIAATDRKLHLAVLEQDLAMVEEMVRNGTIGAEMQSRDQFGRTALHLALCQLDLSDIRAKANATPLKIADLLLTSRMEKTVLDERDSLLNLDFIGYAEKIGCKWLPQVAAYWGALNVLKSLLKQKKNYLNLREAKYGWAALHAATINDKIYCVKYLIEEGANIKIKTALDLTSMHLAAQIGHVNIFRLFAEIDQNIDDVGEHGRTALHYASLNGNTGTAKFLIENNASLNVIDKYGDTAIHLSALNGHLNILKLLVEKCRDINDVGRYKRTALHQSSSNGHTECVQFLLNNNADVNIKDENGDTAIHSAVSDGHLKILKLLVEKCRDINDVGRNKRTALHRSSSEGYPKCAKFLIESNADINIKDEDGDTAIHLAAFNGHLKVLKLLVEKCDDINDVGRFKRTALQFSSWKGHIECVQFLLNNNADVNVKDEYGDTAIHMAASHGHLKVLKLLVEKCRDINDVGRYKRTALHRASSNGYTECVQFLIENNADVNVKDEDGDTAFHWAACDGNLRLMQLLLEKYHDVNDLGQHKRTALHRSSSKGHEECVNFLIKNNADVNAKDKDGDTAIHLAASHGHLNVLKLLVGKCRDINDVGRNKRTALHRSLSEGYTACAKFLIGNDADIKIKDEHGNTAINLAASNGKLEILQLLTEKSQDIDDGC